MTDLAINMDSVLIWGLKSATGAEVYPILAPIGSQPPFIAVTRISDIIQDNSFTGQGEGHCCRHL
jgi:hypothetical protein